MWLVRNATTKHWRLQLCVCVCVWSAVHGDVWVCPNHYEARVGEDVTVHCTSTSTERALWLKLNISGERARLITNSADGEVLDGLKKKYHAKKLGGRKFRLEILDVEPSDEGIFICKQSNADDSTANMTLTIAGMVVCVRSLAC